jgi:hypothetical protein
MVAGAYHVWQTPRLWELASNLEVEEIDITSLDRNDQVIWFTPDRQPTLSSMAAHYRRCQSADMGYPIILDPEGNVVDGLHRIVRAMAEGSSSIRCVRIREMPAPDAVQRFAPGTQRAA